MESAIKGQGAGVKGEGELLQLVSFHLSEEEYGIDILKVQEINRMLSITKVPQSPAYVEGVINLRGKVIPILNLRKKFALAERQMDKNTRIVVVNVDGKVFGVIVDSVSEVLRLSSGDLQATPAIASGHEAAYVRGIGKVGDRLLMLLDVEKILSPADAALLSSVSEQQH